MKKILLLIFIFLISCKSDIAVQNFPEDQELTRVSRAGNISKNENGFILLQEKSKTSSSKSIDEININLWTKSLKVISNISRISIADKSSGFISTEWSDLSNLNKNTNLYKINIVIKGLDIKKENIKISVFEKYKDGGISKNKDLENKIIELILE